MRRLRHETPTRCGRCACAVSHSRSNSGIGWRVTATASPTSTQTAKSREKQSSELSRAEPHPSIPHIHPYSNPIPSLAHRPLARIRGVWRIASCCTAFLSVSSQSLPIPSTVVKRAATATTISADDTVSHTDTRPTLNHASILSSTTLWACICVITWHGRPSIPPPPPRHSRPSLLLLPTPHSSLPLPIQHGDTQGHQYRCSNCCFQRGWHAPR